jgi:hypothetical protein
MSYLDHAAHHREIRISRPRLALAEAASSDLRAPGPEVLSFCSRVASRAGFEPALPAVRGGKCKPELVINWDASNGGIVGPVLAQPPAKALAGEQQIKMVACPRFEPAVAGSDERAETPSPRYLPDNPLPCTAQQRGRGLQLDPKFLCKCLRRQGGRAEQKVERVRQPRSFVAAGGEPPALRRDRFEPFELVQAHARTIGDKMKEGDRRAHPKPTTRSVASLQRVLAVQ